MRFKRTKSLCKSCPLNSRNKVHSRCDIETPFIALLGEAPSEHEDNAESRLSGESELEFKRKEKGPFVGPAGNMLKYACGQAGLMWHTTWRINVLNCFPGHTKVIPSGVEKVYRRWYLGEMLQFKFTSGILTCTPNHPIALDYRDIRAAKDINKGDNIIHTFRVKDMVSSNPNVHHAITSIKQVYRSFNNSKVGKRVVSAYGDFHGDGTAQKVDVVEVNGGLRNHGNSSSAKFYTDFGFKPTGKSTGFVVSLRAFYDASNHFFTTALSPFTGFVSSVYHMISLSFSRVIPTNNHRLATMPNSDTSANKPIFNTTPTDVEAMCDLLDAESLAVQVDRVIEIKRFWFFGHVYNLQTKYGYFIAENKLVGNCRPPNNDITCDEAVEAMKCCKPGFDQEIAHLKSIGVRVIVPAGGTALTALGIEGKISTNRGSVYVLDKNLIAVPTYHPSYILRGAIKEEPVWIADLHKAFELSLKKYVPIKERFNIYPTIEQVEAFAKKAVEAKTTLYVDIEHHGGFNPDWNKITMIGFGTSGSDVLVVPFAKNGQMNYWSTPDEIRTWKIVRSMLLHCPTVYQHALHDVYQLEMKGHKVGHVLHDTLIMHHSIHPELPHSLEYITSIYGQTPTWKGAMKGLKTHMIDASDDESRIYNARDTAVLAQIVPPMLKDLRAEGVEKTYFDIAMPLVRPFIEMMKNGIKVDPERLKSLKRNLLCKETKILKRLYSEIKLPSTFNLDSPEQVQYLLYGKIPPGYSKAVDEKKFCDANPKRSKTTKKYLDLVAKIDRIENVKPLYRTKSMIQNTDEEALLSIKQQALNRLSAIDYLQKKNALQKVEECDIERLLLFINLFLEWSGISKQVSTYTKYPLLRDGRVHTSLGIHGTATGRPNSRDPNLLNIPKEVRTIFVPEKGNCFVQGDFKNLEVFVLGFLTEEPFILDAFKKGISLHDMNAQILFNVTPVKKGDKGYAEYDKFRQAAKKFAFGLNYGGGIQGIYRKILLEVPDFKFSFSAFTQCYNDYFKKLPKYAEWRKLVQDTVTGRSKAELPWMGYRWIRNAFGRKRMFLGTLDEIEREALNTPIQGTAADVTNLAIIDFYAKLQTPAWKSKNVKLLLTVYDSILVECKIGDKLAVAKLLKTAMERECIINNKKRHFTADIEASNESWENMKELKL